VREQVGGSPEAPEWCNSRSASTWPSIARPEPDDLGQATNRTAEQVDTRPSWRGEVPGAIEQLEADGAGKPKGRTCHYALESNGEIHVFDIWESQADCEAFGSSFMPILADLGVGLKEPMVATVHNVITG
jgi:hypothetical protein